jgi:hypothetical protein
VATLQQIRHYLETNHDKLLQKLNARDRTEFQDTFERLQQDWNQEDNEATMLEVTLEQMRAYTPVWNELKAANLVTDESDIVSTPTRTTGRAKTDSTPHSQQVDATTSHEHPSQTVVDRLAMWDKLIVIGKEMLTGLIGLAIVLVTLVIAIITINSVSNLNTYNAGKDILLFMNGLVGVVLGYYFGRVPADARADKAESETKAANSSRSQVLATVRTVLDESSRSSDRGNGSGGLNLSLSQVESLRSVLRQYDN